MMNCKRISVQLSPAQISTTGSGSLLSSASPLPLGFGVLGGLVPVSMPFQFPTMMNLPQLGTGGSSPATSSSSASSNAAFSTLTQSELGPRVLTLVSGGKDVRV